MTMGAGERRANERRRTLLGGSVVFNGRTSTMTCRVKNLGEGGARLVFDAPPLLPTLFELRLDQRDMRCAARRVWSNDREMGVEFE